MRKLGAFFNKLENIKILDVGTGNGNFIKIIQSITDNYDEIVGIDNLDIAISTSRKNFTDERIRFSLMDALSMEFEDNYFDVVCLSNSLHHLESVSVMIKEMERVLKPGGFLLVNEMISDNLNARQKAHKKIHHFAAEIDRIFGESHNDTFRAKEILETLEGVSKLNIIDAWNLMFSRTTTNSKEEIEWLCSTVDRVQKRLVGHERQEEFYLKGEKIKKYIKRVGFDSATQLVVILK